MKTGITAMNRNVLTMKLWNFTWERGGLSRPEIETNQKSAATGAGKNSDFLGRMTK